MHELSVLLDIKRCFGNSKMQDGTKLRTSVVLPTIQNQETAVVNTEQQTLNGYLKLPAIAEEMADSRAVPSQPRAHHEDATGHLLCWGCGEFGQHGHGYRKQVSFYDGAMEMFCGAPDRRAKHVACGASHTAVVTKNNELYLWGNGNSGQLGLNDLNPRMEPHKVCLYSNQASVPDIAGVACGGRHTMVWLENGHVFCFGNNFHAQLGYDFRQKNYKENQEKPDGFWDDDDENADQHVTQPTLLKCLTHRAVVQVACGDKHSVFRFKDGGIACVGSNSHGQIGSGTRDDALMPKSIETFTQPAEHVAAGSQHSMVVTDAGEIYVWGFGKACGNKKEDVLLPIKLTTSQRNVISVAGGSSHSMALTANGSVYTWGCGNDGQLGHGEKVRFLSVPKRVKDRHVNYRCIQIQCGEAFSAAMTEKGLLYMWGKNSHTILPDKPTTHKIFLPYGLNKNFRGGRLERVYCGSWHAIALIGRPELLIRDGNESCESETEHIPTPEEVDAIEDLEDTFRPDASTDDEDDPNNNDVALPNLGEIIDIKDRTGDQSRLSRRETSRLERENTAVSLADFYAPTPDIRHQRSPSPELYITNGYSGQEEEKTNRTVPSTARSVVVQLPVEPVSIYADAGCSPMTLTTTSSNNSSSVTTLSRVPSPVVDRVEISNSRVSRGILKPEKRVKQFDPIKFEKENFKLATTPVISEIVQVSKTSAGAFALPRETTGLAQKHVDFSEMEEIRLKGLRSPEKLSRASKHKDKRDLRDSPLKYRDSSPTKLREQLTRSRLRHVDSSLSYKSDSVLMESPLFKNTGSRSLSSSGQTKNLWNTNTPDEERPYKHHVPKQLPRKHRQGRNSESNFGLQISRSKTIVTPLQMGGFESPDRLGQLRRYAAMHNPQSTSGRVINEKLKPIKYRHVSIPAGRVDSPSDDVEQLFIGSMETPKQQPSFSSGTTWKDKSDFDRHQTPRKVAGIVKMYLGHNDIVGTVENPLYSNLSDGRGYGDPLMDEDPFIVQPLLRKKVPYLAEEKTKLPELSNTQTLKLKLKDSSKKMDDKFENDVLDPAFCNTSRAEMVDSRIS